MRQRGNAVQKQVLMCLWQDPIFSKITLKRQLIPCSKGDYEESFACSCDVIAPSFIWMVWACMSNPFLYGHFVPRMWNVACLGILNPFGFFQSIHISSTFYPSYFYGFRIFLTYKNTRWCISEITPFGIVFISCGLFDTDVESAWFNRCIWARKWVAMEIAFLICLYIAFLFENEWVIE